MNSVKRTITFVEALNITKKEYSILQEIATIERETLEQEYNQKIEENFLIRKLLELKLKKQSYKNLSSIKKEIILAYAILPNDDKIIELLINNNFSLEELKQIIRIRAILKNLISNNIKIETNIDSETILLYKSYIKKLTNIFQLNFGINDPTIILNRITELLTNKKELFNSIKRKKR